MAEIQTDPDKYPRTSTHKQEDTQTPERREPELARPLEGRRLHENTRARAHTDGSGGRTKIAGACISILHHKVSSFLPLPSETNLLRVFKVHLFLPFEPHPCP